jgi:hypothetical protein
LHEKAKEQDAEMERINQQLDEYKQKLAQVQKYTNELQSGQSMNRLGHPEPVEVGISAADKKARHDDNAGNR